jgi:hypothetical protein
LLLRKAAKSGIINYSSGDSKFVLKDGIDISPAQKKALDMVYSVFEKIPSTGIQQILNYAVFDLLQYVTVYPVEDETKLANKNGEVLPDAKLLPPNSSAKDLAYMIHEDIGKGFLHAIDCKTKQRIGADHKLKNGDVIKIISTLSRG